MLVFLCAPGLLWFLLYGLQKPQAPFVGPRCFSPEHEFPGPAPDSPEPRITRAGFMVTQPKWPKQAVNWPADLADLRRKSAPARPQWSHENMVEPWCLGHGPPLWVWLWISYYIIVYENNGGTTCAFMAGMLSDPQPVCYCLDLSTKALPHAMKAT